MAIIASWGLRLGLGLGLRLELGLGLRLRLGLIGAYFRYTRTHRDQLQDQSQLQLNTPVYDVIGSVRKSHQAMASSEVTVRQSPPSPLPPPPPPPPNPGGEDVEMAMYVIQETEQESDTGGGCEEEFNLSPCPAYTPILGSEDGGETDQTTEGYEMISHIHMNQYAQ